MCGAVCVRSVAGSPVDLTTDGVRPRRGSSVVLRVGGRRRNDRRRAGGAARFKVPPRGGGTEGWRGRNSPPVTERSGTLLIWKAHKLITFAAPQLRKLDSASWVLPSFQQCKTVFDCHLICRATQPVCVSGYLFSLLDVSGLHAARYILPPAVRTIRYLMRVGHELAAEYSERVPRRASTVRARLVSQQRYAAVPLSWAGPQGQTCHFTGLPRGQTRLVVGR